MKSIVLVEPEIPENTGFTARLAANFDFSIRIVEPGFNLEEARKTASGAQEKLREASIYDSVDAAIEDLDYVVGTKPGKGVALEEFEPRENTSVMIGRESSGLTSRELGKCDAVVHIDTPGYDSLNQSHAAAVFMHSFSSGEDRGMTSEQKDRVEEKTSGMIQQLLLRSNPSEQEARKLLAELYRED